MILLIDVANLYCRNRFKLGHFTTSDGRPSGGLYGFIKSILALEKRFTPEAIFFALEAGGADERRKINPDYKSHRPSGQLFDEGHLDAVSRWILKSGYTLASSPGREADDVIAHLATTLPSSMMIVSTDRDFKQLLTSDISLCTDLKGRPYTLDDLKTEYDCAAGDYWKIQASAGDPSDNIRGVPGVGEKTAIKIGRSCAWDWSGMLDHARLWDYREQLQVNAQLVRPLQVERLVLEQEPPSAAAVQFFYEQWEFHSLTGKGVK